MDERHPPTLPVEPARSFDLVADAYDRARPSYPPEAVGWLTGPHRAEVVELGAGTGKLTERLVAQGHRVTATDPSPVLLARLRRRAPAAVAAAATAEALPLRNRSADVVVAAQAFHWFEPERALREAARVLRPGGRLGLVWNEHDERIPWVRRLGRIIGDRPAADDPGGLLDDTGLFETVERSTYRFWHPLTRSTLRDLVLSRSCVVTLPEARREEVLEQVEALYDEYGRGADGMLLPYVTRAYRARALPWAAPEPTGPSPADESAALLIDFS